MDDFLGPPQRLSRELRSGQILMIGLSGVIGGVILFSTSGDLLALAGPAGVLLAFAVLGLVTICSMEGLSEMIELWPVSNAMMEFTKTFIDDDLATVVGVAYWYSWASAFATFIAISAEYTKYWNLAPAWQAFILFTLCPVLILALNSAGVKYYGYVEFLGGCLKLLFLIGGIFMMFAFAAKGHFQYFEAGFQNRLPIANNPAAAVCIALPIVAFGFIGVEIVAVTAFEARNPKALRFPAKWIAYIVFLLYFLVVLGEVLTIDWRDPHLQQLETRGEPEVLPRPKTIAIFVLTSFEAGTRFLPGFLEGCIIFCVMSCANTALYVASRTLFGLTREIPSNHSVRFMRLVAKLGTTTPRTHVPGWALLLSALSFCWLPFLHLKQNYSIHYLLLVMSQTSSIACLLVWASQCLAFIRYRKWLDIHQSNLSGPHAKYNRRQRMEEDDQFSSFLSYFQPAVAWLGLIGCLTVVLIFSSASWWNGDVTLKRVVVAYTCPLTFFLIWLVFKLRRKFSSSLLWKGWYVELSDDWEPFSTALAHLEWKIEEKIESPSRRASDDTTIRVSLLEPHRMDQRSLFERILRIPRKARTIAGQRKSETAEVDNREIRELGQIHRGDA